MVHPMIHWRRLDALHPIFVPLAKLDWQAPGQSLEVVQSQAPEVCNPASCVV